VSGDTVLEEGAAICGSAAGIRASDCAAGAEAEVDSGRGSSLAPGSQIANAMTAAAAVGIAQRIQRRFDGWRTGDRSAAGSLRTIAARIAWHRSQVAACASAAVASSSDNPPSAQAASVSASRHDAVERPPVGRSTVRSVRSSRSSR
jgi:hypothetical protein